MQLTTKKKTTALAENMRNVHLLARAIKESSIFIKENKHLILNDEDRKSFVEMSNKINFFISRMDKLYNSQTDSKRLVAEVKGESHIGEISMRIIESVETILNEYKA